MHTVCFSVKTIIGKNENLRFINLALCQNDGKATAVPDMQMQASGNIFFDFDFEKNY